MVRCVCVCVGAMLPDFEASGKKCNTEHGPINDEGLFEEDRSNLGCLFDERTRSFDLTEVGCVQYRSFSFDHD